MRKLLQLVLGTLACMGITQTALAHGFAGQRFFPATLATDDPFVSDELSLPTLSYRRLGAEGDEPAARQTAASIDFTKRITSNFGLSFGATYLTLKSDDGTVRGFDNLGMGAKYQFHKDDASETIASLGVDWDIGNTGAKRIGAESFSTITPAIFFGKGFGKLGEDAKFLRPLALTGSVGVGIPSRKSTTTVDEDGNASVEQHPDVLNVGLALEYSLPYLQSFVKDVGLREPFNRVIPLVELSLEKPLDRGGGSWTGTVNPGFVWAGKYIQLGLEAVIPVSSKTGGGTGVLFQLHFFLDDIAPHGVGRPLL
jgi:hypothetical protein